MYFVREVECVFHSFQGDADAVGENGQEDGHQKNIGVPLFWETIFTHQSAIPHLQHKVH